MKKYFIIFGIIISSFFFSSSMVSATTYDIIIPSSITSIIDNELSTMISTADNVLTIPLNDGTYWDYYLILCRSDNNNCYAYMYKNNNNTSLYAVDRSGTFDFYGTSGGVWYSYSSDRTSLTWGNATSSYYQNIYGFRYFMYRSPGSPSPTFDDLNGTVYNFNYNNYIYTMQGNGSYFPFVYDLYESSISTSSILDDFVSLVLEKLVAITEFISSNDIYLTMFVIFILYFVILLFRRLK